MHRVHSQGREIHLTWMQISSAAFSTVYISSHTRRPSPNKNYEEPPHGRLRGPVLVQPRPWSQGPGRSVCTHMPSVLCCLFWVLALHRGRLGSQQPQRECVHVGSHVCTHVSACISAACHVPTALASCSPKTRPQRTAPGITDLPSSKLSPTRPFKNSVHMGCTLLPGSGLGTTQKRGVNSGDGVPQVSGPLSGLSAWPGSWWIPSPDTVLPPVPMAHHSVLDLLLPHLLPHRVLCCPGSFLDYPTHHLPFPKPMRSRSGQVQGLRAA